MSDECKHAYDLDGRCSRCGDDFGIEIERLRQQLKEAQDPAADGPLQSLIATLREALEERELKIVYQDRRICKFEDALARVKEWVDDEGWCPICDEHTCRKGNCVLAEIGGEDE